MLLYVAFVLVTVTLAEKASLQSEAGLGASNLWCETNGWDVSTFTSRTFDYFGCCPSGTALQCNPWDAMISGGCCDTKLYTHLNCNWLGFGHCYCYNADESIWGEPLEFQAPIERD